RMKSKILFCIIAIASFARLAPVVTAQARNGFTTFNAPGAGRGAGQGTVGQQNTRDGMIAGYYVDANSVSHGFVRTSNGQITSFDAPCAGTDSGQGTLASGINRQGEISGTCVDANGVAHGYTVRWQGAAAP